MPGRSRQGPGLRFAQVPAALDGAAGSSAGAARERWISALLLHCQSTAQAGRRLAGQQDAEMRSAQPCLSVTLFFFFMGK